MKDDSRSPEDRLKDLDVEELPPPPSPRHKLLLSSWITRDIPPRDHLLGSVLCTTSRWLLFGETGIGKSLLAGDIGGAVASGSPLLGWQGRRRARVMYIDGEMPAQTFKERMQLIADRFGTDIPFYGYNREDLGDGEMPPLNEEDGEKWLMKEIDAVRPELIIFDSIMCLLSGTMAEEESWEPAKHLVRRITSRSIAQAWLHHTGHDGSKGFGTKTREWEMDTIVRLAFDGDERDAITMEFRKARLRTPETADEFKPRSISRGENGWNFGDVEGKPGTSRRSDDVAKVKRAIDDAYERLADSVEKRHGFDGAPVQKVSVEAIRNEVKNRGWLDQKETGGLTGAARMMFLRAKTDLVATGRYIEADGLFWKIRK
jgi:hypothetical protein